MRRTAGAGSPSAHSGANSLGGQDPHSRSADVEPSGGCEQDRELGGTPVNVKTCGANCVKPAGGPWQL